MNGFFGLHPIKAKGNFSEATRKNMRIETTIRIRGRNSITQGMNALKFNHILLVMVKPTLE